jgi:hypothetical protein
MAKTKTLIGGRIDRSRFPAAEAVPPRSASASRKRLDQLGDLHLRASEALDDMKIVPGSVKSRLRSLVSEAREDVREAFDDGKGGGLKKSAAQLSRTMVDLLKGSAREAVKLTGGGEDLLFVLDRMKQYRKALLEHVKLVDPIGAQKEMVGRAVLVYRQGKKAFSCAVSDAMPIPESIKDVAGVSVREADVSDPRGFQSLARLLYRGRPGVLDRQNVLMVEAPQGVGLQPKHVLQRAVALYRETCRKRAR